MKFPHPCRICTPLSAPTVLQGARWYKTCIALNFVVILIGVLMTAIVNGVMFGRNEQDLGTQKVLWAAFEQPLVSFLVLTGASLLQFLVTPAAVKTAVPETEVEMADCYPEPLT